VEILSEKRAYARGGGLGLNPPLEHDVLQNFITCAKEINEADVYYLRKKMDFCA